MAWVMGMADPRPSRRANYFKNEADTITATPAICHPFVKELLRAAYDGWATQKFVQSEQVRTHRRRQNSAGSAPVQSPAKPEHG